MTTDELIQRLGGRPFSMRSRTAEYLHGSLGEPCNTHEMAKTFEYTSNFGPGKREVCTTKHILKSLTYLSMRTKERRLPFEIKKLGNDVIMMVQGG
jgi:hypothetical protein